MDLSLDTMLKQHHSGRTELEYHTAFFVVDYLGINKSTTVK